MSKPDIMTCSSAVYIIICVDAYFTSFFAKSIDACSVFLLCITLVMKEKLSVCGHFSLHKFLSSFFSLNEKGIDISTKRSSKM